MEVLSAEVHEFLSGAAQSISEEYPDMDWVVQNELACDWFLFYLKHYYSN